jgi:hypothetical protein
MPATPPKGTNARRNTSPGETAGTVLTAIMGVTAYTGRPATAAPEVAVKAASRKRTRWMNLGR